MSLDLWLLYALTCIAAVATPGATVLLIVAQAGAHGARASIAGILGVLAANTVYMIAAALGLGAVLAASPLLFQAVRWAGAAYLVWIGWRMLRTAASAPRTAGPLAPPSICSATVS